MHGNNITPVFVSCAHTLKFCIDEFTIWPVDNPQEFDSATATRNFNALRQCVEQFCSRWEFLFYVAEFFLALTAGVAAYAAVLAWADVISSIDTTAALNDSSFSIRDVAYSVYCTWYAITELSILVGVVLAATAISDSLEARATKWSHELVASGASKELCLEARTLSADIKSAKLRFIGYGITIDTAFFSHATYTVITVVLSLILPYVHHLSALDAASSLST